MCQRARRWHVASALPPATICPLASPGIWYGKSSEGQLCQGPRASENASHPYSAAFPTLCLLHPSPASEVPPNVLWKGLFSHINQPSPIFAIVHGSSKEISCVVWNSVLRLDLVLVYCVSSSTCVTQCLSVTSSCSRAGGCLRCLVGSRKSLVFLGFQCSLDCDDVRVVLRSEKESVVMCHVKLSQAPGHGILWL